MKLKLLDYRKKANMTQVELASLLGVSFQSVSKWETDTAVPDIYMLGKLCDVFNITLDELMGRQVSLKRAKKDSAEYWGRHIDYLLESRKNLWNDDYFEFLVKKVWVLDQPISIVDFGCGYGYIGYKLLPLLPSGSTYTGIDSNSDLLEKGKMLFKDSDFDVEFIQADVYEYESDQKYDLSICQALLRHTIKPLVVLEKMKESTKSGGKVICIDVNRVSEVIGYHNSAIDYDPLVSLKRFNKGWIEEINQGGRDYASGLKVPDYMRKLGLVNVNSRLNDKLEVIYKQEDIEQFMKISNWSTINLAQKLKTMTINLKKEGLSEEDVKSYIEWYRSNITSLMDSSIDKSITFSRGLLITYGDKA